MSVKSANKCDNGDKCKDGHSTLAHRITADLMNLEMLGRWPAGHERAGFVVWSHEHGASIEVIARVLGVTRERVRQIYLREVKRCSVEPSTESSKDSDSSSS